MTTWFFDLDGVLTDFVSGALRLHGKTLPYDSVKWDFCSQIGFNGVNDPKFWEPMGYDFWCNLDPLTDGMDLFRQVESLVGPERIGIITSPSNNRGAVDGKLDWVKIHLPGYEKRTFVGKSKHLIAAPGKVLIDDHDPNVDAWNQNGGHGVLFPRPWNTAGQLGVPSSTLLPYLEYLNETS